MGVCIEDLGNSEHELSCNWWNWRPTLELIARLVPTVDPEQIDLMSFNGGAGRLDREQARALARGLREQVLPALAAGDRVLLGGEATSEPDDFVLHRDELEKNYSATRDWLERFAAFCETCDGFEVF